MQKKHKLFALAGVTLLSAFTLAACSGGAGNSAKKAATTYSYVYTGDPQSLDYIAMNRALTSNVTTNLVDGLFENDKYGNLIPALATDWTVSKDGLTYTYTLRDDAKWYTIDGEEYAPVVADDFVAAIEHAVKVKSEGLYVIQDSIKGLDDFVNGKTKDFSTVGIKAIDDHTLEYTLAQPETYWNSKLTMSIMMPVNRDFLKSQGEDFGKPSPDAILYNGPYYLTGMTSKSSIQFTKNEDYYDAENVKIDEVNLTYYDGQDPSSLVNGFKEGTYSIARVFPNESSFPAVKKEYGDNIHYTPQNSVMYYFNFNLNRQAHEFTSKKTDEEKESTKKAVLNQDFRQAIAFAINRAAYTAQSVGEDGAKNVLRNSFVPPAFVTSGEKDFGELTAEKLVKYGEEWKDIDLSDAHDAYYNADKAKAEFAKAKEALEKDGVTFPIHLDFAIDKTNEVQVQAVKSLKQSVEETLGKDNVVVDVQQIDTEEMETVFYAESANQADYDMLYGGWGPDYQDPSTFLDIFEPNKGAVITKFGIDLGKNTDIVKAVGLDKYADLLKAAAAENLDVEKRYDKYAEANAFLADTAIAIPYMSQGATPRVSKVVPFSGAFANVGIKDAGSEFYKYMEVSDEIVTAKDYEAAYKTWLEEKSEANAEAEKEAESHVASK